MTCTRMNECINIEVSFTILSFGEMPSRGKSATSARYMRECSTAQGSDIDGVPAQSAGQQTWPRQPVKSLLSSPAPGQSGPAMEIPLCAGSLGQPYQSRLHSTARTASIKQIPVESGTSAKPQVTYLQECCQCRPEHQMYSQRSIRPGKLQHLPRSLQSTGELSTYTSPLWAGSMSTLMTAHIPGHVLFEIST